MSEDASQTVAILEKPINIRAVSPPCSLNVVRDRKLRFQIRDHSNFSNRHGLAVLAPDVAQAVADLADGGERFDAVEYARQEILRPARGVFEERERDLRPFVVAALAQREDALDLRALDRWVNAERGHGSLFFGAEAVDADDHGVAGLDGLLILIGRLLNLAMHVADLDGVEHPAHRVNLLDVVERALLDLARQLLDGVGTRERVNRVGDARLVGDDLLRAEREPRGCFGWKRERFVHRVRVERLRAAQHRGERLNRRADDVDFRLLRGERRACGLRVEAEHLRARVARVEALAHDSRPETARGAELRDLFEEVVVRVEEEGEARRELVNL